MDNLKEIIQAMQEKNYIRALHCCKLQSDVFNVDVGTVEHELLWNIFYDISNGTNNSIDYANGVIKTLESVLDKKE